MNPDAGRALDAIIAEKVMGWTNISRGALGNDAFGWNPSLRGHVPPHGRIPIPCYSTDIAAAWEVAEKLGDMKLSKNNRRDMSGKIDYGCYFELERNTRRAAGKGFAGHEPPWHYADTAPLAIVRAALKAVGL